MTRGSGGAPKAVPVDDERTIAPMSARLRGMEGKLAALAAAQGGVITFDQALACGLSLEEVRRRIRRGEWIVLRRGIYAVAATAQASERARHAVDVAGALLSYEGTDFAAAPTDPLVVPVAAGHRSAALLWNLPAPKPERPPGEVPATGTEEGPRLISGRTIDLVSSGRGRRTSRYGVRLRPACLPAGHLARIGVLPVTSRARTAVDLARQLTWRQAVAVGDAALHAGCTEADLHQAAAFCARWPGGGQAVRMAAFADGRAESPVESLARVVLAELGFPAPDLQVVLFVAGGLEVRLDLLFRQYRTALEIDGKVKYTDPYGPAGNVVWEEKLREDAIRDDGYEVVRTNHRELTTNPKNLADKLHRAFARACRSH